MKIYKITLYISILLLAVLAPLSVLLNCWNNNAWITFTLNWCSGIACSIMVVIITTLIQFTIEKKKAIDDLASIASALLFHNDLYGSYFTSGVIRNANSVTTFDQIEDNWRESLNKDMSMARSVLMNLEFFFKNAELVKMQKQSILFSIPYIDKTEKNYAAEAKLLERAYSNVTRDIVVFAETVSSLNINDYYKKVITEYTSKHKNDIN